MRLHTWLEKVRKRRVAKNIDRYFFLMGGKNGSYSINANNSDNLEIVPSITYAKDRSELPAIYLRKKEHEKRKENVLFV